MDIKSKNIKSTKSIITSYVVYALIVIFISVSIIEINSIGKNIKSLFTNTIYTDSAVSMEIDDYIGMSLDYAIYYKNDDYVNDINNITQYEIDNYKQSIQQKIEEEYNNISEILDQSYYYEDEYSYDEYQERLEEERKKIEEKYDYSDEEILEKVLEAKKVAYENLKLQLSSYNNIHFVAYDKYNNIWIGEEDSNVENLMNSCRYYSKRSITSKNGVSEEVYINGKKSTDSNIINRINRDDSGYYSSGSYVSSYIQEQSPNYYYSSNYDVDLYIWIPKNIQKGDRIYSAFEEVNQYKDGLKKNIIMLVVSIAILIVLLKIKKKQDIRVDLLDTIVNKIKDIALEYKIAMVVILYWVYSQVISNAYDEYYYDITALRFNSIILSSIILIMAYIIIRALLANYREETLFANNITVRIYNVVSDISGRGSIIKNILSLLALYCIAGVILLILAIVFYDIALIFFIVGLIMTFVLLVHMIKRIVYLDKIMVGAKDAAEGNLNYKIEEKGKGHLTELAHNINNIKEGLQVSLKNEMKSEKMKSELITNVSHDLKTPLTSIINYIDLLKRENIEPESARDYIKVLENKSQRLKVLIEDLFEASKAASGEMQLNIAPIDVVQLLRQTLGEFDERLQECSLNVKAVLPEDKIIINADGKRLFRVFENLIGNIAKYSMKNTRVYINMISTEEEIYITMKNISSYELNFNADEITNRFKRGDEARTTEGSGLGLAIAKSIIELHGGKFYIEVDGDLFKSTIVLNK